MSRLLVAVGLIVCGLGTAQAEPLFRFGLTFGMDRNAPEAHEVGPLFAVGASAGRFSAEANYTYLSFFGYTQTIHRAGVALRADVLRRPTRSGDFWGLFGEVGAGKRWGSWLVNDELGHHATEQHEVQLAAGYELAGSGGSWQLALRFGIARRDPRLESVCRGVTCPMALPASSGLAESVMTEWTWTLGRSKRR